MKSNMNNNLNIFKLPKEMNQNNEAPPKPRTHNTKMIIQQLRTTIELPHILKGRLLSQHPMERKRLQMIMYLQILNIFLQAQPNLNLVPHLNQFFSCSHP